METRRFIAVGGRIFCLLLAARILFGCGGGGGGGGESGTPAEADVGIGWIEFTVPDPNGTTYTTDLLSVKLAGTTFIDPDARCPGGLGAGYGVSWHNEANGRGGAAQAGLNCLTYVFAWWTVDEGVIPLEIGDNRIRVTATDAHGNIGRNTILVKRLPDAAPPSVSATSPPGGAANVPVNTLLTATFSEAMEPASVNAASFTLKTSGGEPVGGTVVYDSRNRIGKFIPAAPLAYDTAYDATLNTGIRDLAGGNPLPQDYGWHFSTGPNPDVTAPEVVSTSPVDGSYCVPVTSPLQVDFSEEMDPESINTATLLVTGPDNLPVAGTVAYAAKTATFSPAQALAYDTPYIATLAAAAKDLAGNPLAGDHVWSFATVASAGAGTWNATSTAAAPLARAYHAGVWTGSRLLVAGGFAYDPEWGEFSYTDTGGSYDPRTDIWQSIAAGAPPVRDAAAVWTGEEMLVWGGRTYGETGYSTGGRYLPAADAWQALSTEGAPSGRYEHTAVWTGEEMIVWGGHAGGKSLNSGGRYRPATGTWLPLASEGAPAPRYGHSAVWTGEEMIVWGGAGDGPLYNDGGRYNPATDSWEPLSLDGAPSERYGHTAVWTGEEMIVWGSYFGSTASGGRYHPASDSWRPTALLCAPAGRERHGVAWTGGEMLVWGGTTVGTQLGDGAAYDPRFDLWTPLAAGNAPTLRSGHTAVWTGEEMIIWGGYDGGLLKSGGRFAPP